MTTDRILTARVLLTHTRQHLADDDAAAALLLAAAAIIDPVSDELAERAGTMLLHAVREALEAWHDPVGIVDVPPATPPALTRSRRDRVKHSRRDAASEPTAGRPWARRGGAPTQDPGYRPPNGRDELRQRLLNVIVSACGSDRQCHLSVAGIAARARTDRERARKELSAMVKAGLITRFAHSNGRTATTLVARGSNLSAVAVPPFLKPAHDGDVL